MHSAATASPASAGQAVSPLVRVLKDPDAEEKLRPLSLELVRRLWTLLRPYRGRRNTLVILVLMRSMQLPLLAWSIGAAINGPIAGHAPLSHLMLGAGGVLLLSIFTQATFVYRQRLALEIGEAVIHDLRCRVFEHLQRMPMSFYARTKTGRVISRITSDCEAIRVGVQDVLFVSLVQLGQMCGAGALMCWYDWKLFSVIVAISPLLWVIGRAMRRRLSDSYRHLQESFSRVTATIAESVAVIRVTQAMAREEVNAQSFRQLMSDHAGYNMNAARAGAVLMPLLEMTGQIALAAVLVVGAWRTLSTSDPMPVGDLIQFWFLAGLFFSPIQILGNQYNQALTAMAGAERVFGLLDQTPDWCDEPGALPLAEPTRGEISVQHVTFGYDPHRPVLRNVSFEAKAGDSIALVGETGSGKSTLAGLIARYYLPDSGEVQIDGQNTRFATTESLARRIAIVPQQNFLFTGTVLENILAGRRGATEADARAALRELACERLLHELPQGLDTLAGSRGGQISLGQRQLVCFARALIADPRILILDEATSAVDSLTELRIQRALNRLLQGRTGIVIAHRLSTIRSASQILVLDQGQIIERGDHVTLLENNRAYAHLYRRFTEHTGI
jgi:ATP-binding cassette, subfamily B, bacterial